MNITASEARRRLFPLIREVNDDRSAVVIVSTGGNAVLVSEDEWNSIQETAYLLRSPKNAERLRESLSRVRRGEVEPHDLIVE